MHARSIVAVLLLSLLTPTSYAQDDYDDDDGGADEDMDLGDEDGEEGLGGMGDEGPQPHELEHLKTVSDFDKFLDNVDASVVGAFTAETMNDPTSLRPADWDDEEDGEWEPATIENPAFADYKAVQQHAYGWRFAYTTAPEVLAKIKSKTGGVFLYRSPRYVSKEHGDRARERFPGDKLTSAGLTHWLETKAQPLVGEFNDETMFRYTSAVLLVFLNLDWENNEKNVKYVLKRARKVAVGLKGKLAVAVAHFKEDALSEYGLKSEKESDIFMVVRSGHAYEAPKYSAPAGTSFNADTLSAFANSYLAGELTPYKDEFDADGDSTEKSEL